MKKSDGLSDMMLNYGSGDLSKQERSLGLSVLFAGCDYESLKRSSDQEAEAVFSNCNIKIKLKENK